MRFIAAVIFAAAAVLPAHAQDAQAWLDKEGLDAVDRKTLKLCSAIHSSESRLTVGHHSGG